MAIYPINNLEEAEDFCNKLMKFAKKEDFKPIKVDASFGKKRSNNQNAYYWKSLEAYVLPFFAENPVRLIELVLKAVKFSITKEFIHELYKMIYRQGASTTKSNTVGMVNYMDSIRHDFFHDYGIDIPGPTTEKHHADL